jgi:hypothetical protein
MGGGADHAGRSSKETWLKENRTSALSDLEIRVGCSSWIADDAGDYEVPHGQEGYRPPDGSVTARVDGCDQEVQGNEPERATCSDPVLVRSDKGIEEGDARFLEITGVVRGHCEAVCQGCRGNHAVQHGQRLSFSL